MGWQSDRPVPWRRVSREAAIFLVVGAVVLTLLSKKKDASIYVGLAVGMVFYVGIVAVFAKFGYQRQTFREARDRRAATAAASRVPASDTGRARPAPTRRTSTGPSQRPNRSKRKKR